MEQNGKVQIVCLNTIIIPFDSDIQNSLFIPLHMTWNPH